jgi:hypothetical protein
MVDSERSSVKTIRLSKSLEKSLEREAKSRKMSLNSFVSSVLAKYDEWDRLAEKFGMMSIPPDEVIALLDNLSGAQIEMTAKKCGEAVPKAIMDFWFSKTTPEAFLKYLSLRMNYQKFVNHEVITGTDGQFILTARHEHGRKWSLWSCNYLAEAIKANFEIEAQFEINGNTYRLECPRLVRADNLISS